MKTFGIISMMLFVGFLVALWATPDACPVRYHWSTNVMGFLWLATWWILAMMTLDDKEKK